MDYPHEAPDLECGWCGIYAVKTPRLDDRDDAIYGQVNLWGRVIEHEHGYRAQYAYPALLYTPPGGQLVPQVARIYDVPWTAMT